MIDQLMETFARHDGPAPAPDLGRRGIDAVATRRRRLRKGLVGGTAVALVALFVVGYLRSDAVSTAPSIGASAGASTAVARGPMTFLIVGTDQRPWDTNRSDLLRSDSMMLAHLPADRATPYLISIYRDEMVPFQNGQDKLNGVFARGGAKALRTAVQALTGIQIDGVVEVDFAGLIKVTDAVGGVDLCVPRRLVSEHTQRYFEPGCRRFTGEEAMDYLRQRRPFAAGDFDRQQHVREYVKALYTKLGEADLPKLLLVIEAAGAAVRIDAGAFQLAAVLGAARDAKGGVVSIAPPATFDGLRPEAAQLWAAVRDGQLPDWVTANPGQVDQR